MKLILIEKDRTTLAILVVPKHVAKEHLKLFQPFMAMKNILQCTNLFQSKRCGLSPSNLTHGHSLSVYTLDGY